ncbi:MAG: class I SAM-dependent methyltransferase [Bacteroidales bacterium]|nr:class I SAM-dependent methyltransferase [Bacteroidales bacterium]
MTKSLLSSFKEFVEISFWKYKKLTEGNLSNGHYQHFYTNFFYLPESFYNGKRILDIGCGPRGSLEWATMAEERIGIDPLADKYLKMGAKDHKMQYIKAYSENLPFSDNYFDVVCSFNSLDHVENLNKSTSEITRVLKTGGLFLLIVDIHNYPTPTEPQTLKWDFLITHFDGFEILLEERLKSIKPGRIYFNAQSKIPLSEKNTRNGLLVSMLQKK